MIKPSKLLRAVKRYIITSVLSLTARNPKTHVTHIVGSKTTPERNPCTACCRFCVAFRVRCTGPWSSRPATRMECRSRAKTIKFIVIKPSAGPANDHIAAAGVETGQDRGRKVRRGSVRLSGRRFFFSEKKIHLKYKEKNDNKFRSLGLLEL